MLAIRFLTLCLLVFPINGFANLQECRNGAILAAEDRLHLDSPTARDVFGQLPVIPFPHYTEWRDRLWAEAQRADTRGEAEVVLSHLKTIISLKRLVLMADVRNSSLVGTIRASKRHLIEQTRRLVSLNPEQHRDFWVEWDTLLIVPSAQLTPLVTLAIHMPSARDCDACLQQFFARLKTSQHRKLQMLAEELPNRHPS